MKLKRTKSYRKAGKDYHAWRVYLPAEAVEELGWEDGTELQAAVTKRGMLLKPEDAQDED